MCHSEHREESEDIYFMYTDSSLRSGWHIILIAILYYDTSNVLFATSKLSFMANLDVSTSDNSDKEI